MPRKIIGKCFSSLHKHEVGGDADWLSEIIWRTRNRFEEPEIVLKKQISFEEPEIV
jgi:hypothetical protein